MERLDKIISAQTGLSRKEVKALASRGLITVDGVAAAHPESRIDPEAVKITVEGRPLTYRKYLYLMLNKPRGYVSSTEEAGEHTVLELVPDRLMRDGLFPAGRLDKDSTGMVILTDDGDFAHRILAPKNHIPKIYEVELDKPLTEAMKTGMLRGVILKDGVCRAAELQQTGENAATVTLTQGRYHQIKRMFGCYGAKVTSLKRVRMGGLPLDDSLPRGGCRELTEEELARLEGPRPQPDAAPSPEEPAED